MVTAVLLVLTLWTLSTAIPIHAHRLVPFMTGNPGAHVQIVLMLALLLLIAQKHAQLNRMQLMVVLIAPLCPTPKSVQFLTAHKTVNGLIGRVTLVVLLHAVVVIKLLVDTWRNLHLMEERIVTVILSRRNLVTLNVALSIALMFGDLIMHQETIPKPAQPLAVVVTKFKIFASCAIPHVMVLPVLSHMTLFLAIHNVALLIAP